MAGPTYRYLFQFAYFWIIVKENSLSKGEYCPCTINTTAQTASCSSRQIKNIPRCIPRTTKILDFSFNDLSYQPRQFQIFTSLIYLDLSGNIDFKPGNDTFEKLTQLQELYLNDTNLGYIQTSPFAKLINLKVLGLHNSRLGRLLPKCYVNLVELIYLDLSKNQIAVIRNNQFSMLINLQYLNLGNNYKLSFNEHSFSGLAKLQGLDLQNCRLKTLSLDIFSQLHQLRYLNLSGNFLGKLGKNTFLNLSYLTDLDLSFNRLLSLGTHSFDGLVKLKFLSFKGSKILNLTSITPELFQPLEQLEELHVEGVCTQGVSDRKIYNDCGKIDELLSSVSSLKKLYLDNFLINFLGRGIRFLQALEELNFVAVVGGNRCIIDSLSNYTFDNLGNLSISKIRIEMCRIINILPYTFSYFRKLISLELISVKIRCDYGIRFETGLQNTNIKYFRFQPMCDEEFSLAIKAITGIDKTSLERLEISNSSVSFLLGKFFFKLPVSLKYIFLQNNSLRYIENSNDLYCLPNLQILNLSGQRDLLESRKNISLKAFTEDFRSQDAKTISADSDCNQNLQSIPLKFVKNNKSINHIQEIEYRIKSNRRWPCSGLPLTIWKIDISHSWFLCEILHLLGNVNNSLKTLNFAYQVTTCICCKEVWNVTKLLSKLENLNASGNSIKNIPSDAFSPLRNLKILSLRENYLTVISFDLKTLVLEELDVSDNNIMYLSYEMTQTLSKIAQQSNLNIYITGNSLVCDCERIAFVAWLRYTKSIYQKDKLTCNLLNTNYDISKIAKLYETLKYECTAQEVVKSCIVGFVLLNLMLAIVGLVWYRRWRVRHLLAIVHKIVSPYHPIEESEVEFGYDVYISYACDYNITQNETLHEFVTQKLYPGLQRRGFRVFIREEIEPGMGLYNGISRSLRRSKKVISLITKNYCKDHWNVLEFNMAVLEGIHTKRQVIIPVVLESLRGDDLHAELYAYLSSEPVFCYSCKVTEANLLGFLTEKIRDNRDLD